MKGRKRLDSRVVFLTLTFLIVSVVFTLLYPRDGITPATSRRFTYGPSWEESEAALRFFIKHIDKVLDKLSNNLEFQILLSGRRWELDVDDLGEPVISMACDENGDKVVGYGLHGKIVDDNGNPVRIFTIWFNTNLEITEILDFPAGVTTHPAILR